MGWRFLQEGVVNRVAKSIVAFFWGGAIGTFAQEGGMLGKSSGEKEDEERKIPRKFHPRS